MKCAKLQLQERTKPITKTEKIFEKPRRYCQKRMVNPDHQEDPRWMDVLERFRCDQDDNSNDAVDYTHDQEIEDLYLTVQTLKFEGPIKEQRRPKRSFKFKNLNGHRKHRMFVKQIVSNDYDDGDKYSDLTNFYFDDYVKYLFNSDKSRPTSGKSTLFLQELSSKFNNNKHPQAETVEEINKKSRKYEHKVKNIECSNTKKMKEKNIISDNNISDAKIMFNKYGKRKCLTISRAQSPETVQVIRVDVVCNNNSKLYEEKSIINKDESQVDVDRIDIKKSHFADKYLLTNTIKTLDENLAGGAKVTLFCKTFKLAERTKTSETSNNDNTRKVKNMSQVKIQKSVSKTGCNIKRRLQ